MPPRGDFDGFAARVREAAEGLPDHRWSREHALAAVPQDPMRFPPAVRSYHYGPVNPGSTLNFEIHLRLFRPDLIVPESAAAPAFGPDPGWSPDKERPPAPGEPCPRCGTPGGDPAPGPPPDPDPASPAVLVCPACLSGPYDRELADQRRLAGEPPPEPPPNPRFRPAPGSRKARRAAARPGAGTAR